MTQATAATTAAAMAATEAMAKFEVKSRCFFFNYYFSFFGLALTLEVGKRGLRRDGLDGTDSATRGGPHEQESEFAVVLHFKMNRQSIDIIDIRE